MKTRTIGVLLAFTVAAFGAATFVLGQGQSDRPTVGAAVRADLSPPLRSIPAPALGQVPNREVPNRVKFIPPGRGPKLGADSLTQLSSAPSSSSLTPAPSLSFDGTSDDDNAAVAGGRVVPPDTNGDVGPNHYVQMNNSVFEVFNKSGVSLFGPAANNTIWAGFGGICQTNNDGDPIVFHDQLADRWVFSQFAIGSTGHQCFAVSQTPDPTGPYYRYDFEISPGLNGFNDYPKIGMWPDGYYLSANEFGGGSQSFQFAIAVAFERDRMLTGDPTARFVKFNVPASGGTTFFSLQPSHWEGPTPPPAGAPNVFAMAVDIATWGGSGSDGYQLWNFAVNWINTAASTFTSLGRVATTDFDANLCNFAQCVPQPSPGELLDTLSQFTMFRLMYRNLSGVEVLVGDHNVDVGSNRAGVRWFELRKSGSSWTLYQTGTYAPADGLHRWMASTAMDGAGNIAVSYTVSSAGLIPSIRYNTRTASDPLGQLPGGEVDCVAGGGVQTNSFNRWGDYAAISVDPVDDCTFWLTNEYYANSGSFDFKTRICAFTLPGCGGGPGNTPPSVTITAPANGSSFGQGVSVNFAGTATDAEDGNISANLSWSSNLDGVIGSGASFSTSSLSVGTHTITASVLDSGGLPGSDAITVTITGGSTEATFVSIAVDDGWILESSETSNQGGSLNSNNSGTASLRVGDDRRDRQYKTILSFDTSSIPDGATIVSATLRLRRGTVSGTNPFQTHGQCLVDAVSGAFGGNSSLQTSDFQAAATAVGVATLSNATSNGAYSSGSLNAAGRAAVNKTGLTQYRIYFQLDDNDDGGNDYIGYYSGNNSTPANQPILVVVYQ